MTVPLRLRRTAATRLGLRRGRGLIGALLVATILPLAAGAAADDADRADGTDDTNPAAAIAAIPSREVAVAADRDTRALREIERALAESPVEARIDAELPGVTKALDLQAQHTDLALHEVSLQSIKETHSRWSALGLDLPQWQSELTNRATEVDQARARLYLLEEVWKATRENARHDNAPPAIVDHIAEVLSRIAGLQRLTSVRRSSLLTLEARVATQETRVEAALAALDELHQQLMSLAFERDSAPIWAPELRASQGEDLGTRVHTVIKQQGAKLRAFAGQQRDGLLLQLALFGLLTALLFSARNRVRRRTEEEGGLGSIADLCESPRSAALLLTILAAPWVYPHIPPVVVELLVAAALLPTVLILRRIIAKPLMPLLNVLIVFYFLDRVREIAAPVPLVARVVFLSEMLGGMILLAWMLWPARLSEIPTEAAGVRALQAMSSAGRLAFALFLTAFVADAFGYSRLGHLIGASVLQSAYMGVVAFATVEIFDSLATFALRVPPLGALRMVKRSRYALREKIHRVIALVAIAVWALLSLDLVGLREPIFAGLTQVLDAELQVGSVVISLGAVLSFGFTIWLAFFVSKIVRAALEADVYPRLHLTRGVPYAASTFTHYAILLLGFFLAIGATGIDLNRFAIVAGAFGVGIGFGLQNVVNNFVSGLILLSERPVQVGDTIEAGDALGEVKRIGIRSSTVRTWSGAEMIIPNSELVSQRVINWTLSDRQRRIDIPVGVAYGTDRHQVLALLLEVAEANPDVLDHPEPLPLFRGFGASSLDFELRAWTERFENFYRVQSDLSVQISDALDRAGIEIPFPQRDLHLRSIDEPAARILKGTERT